MIYCQFLISKSSVLVLYMHILLIFIHMTQNNKGFYLFSNSIMVIHALNQFTDYEFPNHLF